ncbi:MAG: hypothetical protein PHH30_10505, partial [Bacteroidales bacterium]|nr:hypothetical protein [Bacteroidales bacterium]
ASPLKANHNLMDNIKIKHLVVYHVKDTKIYSHFYLILMVLFALYNYFYGAHELKVREGFAVESESQP